MQCSKQAGTVERGRRGNAKVIQSIGRASDARGRPEWIGRVAAPQDVDARASRRQRFRDARRVPANRLIYAGTSRRDEAD